MIALAAVLAAGIAPAGALVVTEPQALAALEQAGLGAGAVAFDAPAARDNAALAKSPLYLDVVHTLARDLRALYGRDKAWGAGMRFSHRGFDAGWLTSKDARFELTGVVNRVDRRPFDPGTCGEVRLVYRLAYTTTTKSGSLSSRLPMTLNVVFTLPDDGAGCRKQAALFAEPLAPGVLAAAKLLAVEVNLQTARWPSTIRPDLGGHADYLLRVFHRAGGHLAPAPLENTPDVDRLRRDPKLRRDLVAFLAQHVPAIDAGTVVVPERFLATRAVSVTPRGLARPQNRPFARALAGVDLSQIALPSSPSSTIRTEAALLRRLDGLSCVGCHQSRSLAGFHLVGIDRTDEHGDGALAAGLSPHLEEDLPRRRAYLDALLAGAPVDEKRAPPDHETARGGFGDACGLGDAGFSSWTCAPGFSCAAVDDALVGECMPDAPAAGSACALGAVDFARDRIAPKSVRAVSCAHGGFCEGVDVGFPGGMCSSSCDAVGPHAACGAVAELSPFNACLARGAPFSTCAKLATPAALRSCGPGDPCRPDYLCARAPSGAGVCLPPYFVLQMRVDGHPRPR